jgi:hypothetical protein
MPVQAKPLAALILPAFQVEFNSHCRADVILTWAIHKIEEETAIRTWATTGAAMAAGVVKLESSRQSSGTASTDTTKKKYEASFALYLVQRFARSFPFLVLRHVEHMCLIIENATCFLPKELIPPKSSNGDSRGKGSGARLRVLMNVLKIFDAMSETLAHEPDCLKSAVLSFMGVMNSLETFPVAKGREKGKGASSRILVDSFGRFLTHIHKENSHNVSSILESDICESFGDNISSNVLHFPYSPRTLSEGVSRTWHHVLDSVSKMYPDGPLTIFLSKLADPVMEGLEALRLLKSGTSVEIRSSGSSLEDAPPQNHVKDLPPEDIAAIKPHLKMPVQMTSYPFKSFSFLPPSTPNQQQQLQDGDNWMNKLNTVQEYVSALEQSSHSLPLVVTHFVMEFIHILRYRLHPSLVGRKGGSSLIWKIQSAAFKLLLSCLHEGCSQNEYDSIMRFVHDACRSAPSEEDHDIVEVGPMAKSLVMESLFEFLCHGDKKWCMRILTALLNKPKVQRQSIAIKSEANGSSTWKDPINNDHTTAEVLDDFITLVRSSRAMQH